MSKLQNFFKSLKLEYREEVQGTGTAVYCFQKSRYNSQDERLHFNVTNAAGSSVATFKYHPDHSKSSSAEIGIANTACSRQRAEAVAQFRVTLDNLWDEFEKGVQKYIFQKFSGRLYEKEGTYFTVNRKFDALYEVNYRNSSACTHTLFKVSASGIRCPSSSVLDSRPWTKALKLARKIYAILREDSTKDEGC